MRKYRLIIISIIIMITSFVNLWYLDYLFDKLFLISILINFIILIIYVIYLIKAIRLIKMKKYINIVALIIFIITAVFVIFFPFRITKTKVELKLYSEERNRIIQMVKNNKLIADENGNIKLPNEYKKTSTSGEIFVYQNNDNGIVIGFWVFRGMMSGSVELIYSTGGEALIKENETGHPIKSIDKLSNNWFYVITEY